MTTRITAVPRVVTMPAPAGEIAVPFADCHITADAQAAALRVLQSGWVTTGREAVAFEAEFATAVGATHAVAVSSCTQGIELALRSLGLPPGSLVLSSTMTFCGAVHAIVHAGLQPVLVDVDPATGMPTPATVRTAAQAYGRPAAMVVVHWAGDVADVPALAEAAGVPLDRVVVDAAHALGTYAGVVPVGSGCGATCFSFYATKNLPLGEGGMITTDDDARADWLRRARLHGMTADAWRRYLPGGSWRYNVADAGLKANMTDVQAAMGRAQLAHFPAWQRRRAQIAARYDEQLAGLPGVRLPHRPAPGDGTHAWHLYPVRLRLNGGGDRDKVIAALSERAIGTSVHFVPVHRLAYFSQAALIPSTGLTGADALFDQLLSLPMYPRLTDAQVDAVCRAVTGIAHRGISGKGTE
ncbi:dTDP-4-amino-4,6-dideoxygalactose transaminase [Kribbella aluminosa]|uniref:dTDP-4-amino-4,6-dideoxygalactose transaminase n=1 Tax=Kribbella aluminosa TaxID=416017 RepID=A0ABS4UV88_9ACTN|nr:DegT/DnrJ/EryC1/StrS family aminotransferase [Kribbella aluminosa]MBP2355552.1 dTDP-4-amino-4,6-dideoxygalactose transaminase [Kribbella aluminosa]